MSLVIPFEAIEERARERVGGMQALAGRLPQPKSAEELRALGDDTPVGKFIANRGPGVHRVAYEVSDLRGQLKRLAEQGVELIDEEPHEGLFGLEVAFVHPHAMHGVLAELVAVA